LADLLQLVPTEDRGAIQAIIDKKKASEATPVSPSKELSGLVAELDKARKVMDHKQSAVLNKRQELEEAMAALDKASAAVVDLEDRQKELIQSLRVAEPVPEGGGKTKGLDLGMLLDPDSFEIAWGSLFPGSAEMDPDDQQKLDGLTRDLKKNLTAAVSEKFEPIIKTWKDFVKQRDEAVDRYQKKRRTGAESEAPGGGGASTASGSGGTAPGPAAPAAAAAAGPSAAPGAAASPPAAGSGSAGAAQKLAKAKAELGADSLARARDRKTRG